MAFSDHNEEYPGLVKKVLSGHPGKKIFLLGILTCLIGKGTEKNSDSGQKSEPRETCTSNCLAT